MTHERLMIDKIKYKARLKPRKKGTYLTRRLLQGRSFLDDYIHLSEDNYLLNLFIHRPDHLCANFLVFQFVLRLRHRPSCKY
jgi:hypothetical protein